MSKIQNPKNSNDLRLSGLFILASNKVKDERNKMRHKNQLGSEISQTAETKTLSEHENIERRTQRIILQK